MTIRLGIVVSHPIQHFCPQYLSWSQLEGVEIRVFFATRHGLDAYEDKSFGRTIQWDTLALDFAHEFLPGAATQSLGSALDEPLLEGRLASFGPNALIVYGYALPLQRRAIAWACKTNVPLLMIGDSELRGHRSLPKRIAKAVILPNVLRKIAIFLTVGDANEAYYRHYGVSDDKFVRCPFPVDVKRYDIVLSKKEKVRLALRSELQIPTGHTVLLMVGKIVPGKRQKDLVEFSNGVQDTRDDLTVVLVGTGEDELFLKGLARKVGPGGVVFAGFIPPSRLPEFYCASDIYVHCSERDAHSLAISEAVYCGLPVVVTDRCGSFGPSEDVRTGLNGYVYPCGDAKGLASTLFSIIDAPRNRELMGVASSQIGKMNQDLAHGRALIQALNSIAHARRLAGQ